MGAFDWWLDYKGRGARTSRVVLRAFSSLGYSVTFAPLFCLAGISILMPNELLWPTSCLLRSISEIANW
jgi:hypothetical protein